MVKVKAGFYSWRVSRVVLVRGCFSSPLLVFRSYPSEETSVSVASEEADKQPAVLSCARGKVLRIPTVFQLSRALSSFLPNHTKRRTHTQTTWKGMKKKPSESWGLSIKPTTPAGTGSKDEGIKDLWHFLVEQKG